MSKEPFLEQGYTRLCHSRTCSTAVSTLPVGSGAVRHCRHGTVDGPDGPLPMESKGASKGALRPPSACDHMHSTTVQEIHTIVHSNVLSSMSHYSTLDGLVVAHLSSNFPNGVSDL